MDGWWAFGLSVLSQVGGIMFFVGRYSQLAHQHEKQIESLAHSHREQTDELKKLFRDEMGEMKENMRGLDSRLRTVEQKLSAIENPNPRYDGRR